MDNPSLSELDHFIAREAVAPWLADSELAAPVWHTTGETSMGSFRAHGVVIGPESTGVCAGFYCSREPWKGLLSSPNVPFEVAVRTVHPWRCKSPADLRPSLELIDYVEPWTLRMQLIERGYDSVLCEDGVVIVLRAETARIVYPWQEPRP